MRAFIFPGQGSQAVGMGAALAEASRTARDVFERGRRGARPEPVPADARGARGRAQADRECAAGDHGQCAGGVPGADASTAASIWRRPRASSPATASANIPRLCAAGSFDLATTAKLLKLRGRAMQAAVPVGEGAMAALLGADLALAQKIADAAAQGEVCTVANDNDPSQVVISGHKAAIDRAIAMAKDMGAKRAVPLPVSAPFHCPLMQPAADAMADALELCRRRAARGAGVRQCHRAAGDRSRTRSATSWSSRSRAWSAGARASPTWPTRASRSSSSWAARCSARWSSASSPTRR